MLAPETLAVKGAPDASLEARVAEMLELTDRRGYGIPLEEFGRLLLGGPGPGAYVGAAAMRVPGAAVVDGHVVRADRAPFVASMIARRDSHRIHEAQARALAEDFAGRLVSTCPLVRSVSLTGSMASGGFDPRDDIDLNLVVRDGAKYTVYLWSLALGAVTSLRNRAKPSDEMGRLPLLPKVICINVVWEEAQVRPFVRQDKWLAFELLMHRPLLGTGYWEHVLAQNPWLGHHFPQIFDAGFLGGDAPAAVRMARAPRRGRSFFGYLASHPGALALTEAVARPLVIALHRAVSLLRRRRPEARARESFVNLVKRPYSVYDLPGKEREVPDEALAAR